MSELFFRFPGFKTKAVTLSYDDGTYFDTQLVEIINRYKIKCTFNLNSFLFGNGNRLPKEEIIGLYKGHELAVHTLTHPHLENLDDVGVIKEVVSDRENLEQLTGNIINGMAYPFGLSDKKRIPDILKNCGIKYARTVDSTSDFSLPDDYLMWRPTCHHFDPNINKLIESFLLPDDTEHPWRTVPKLFYLWGHSYEFKNCFDKFEDICNRLGNKDTVWYATNGEIIDYIDAYKSLRFFADGSKVYNPTLIDIYASSDGLNKILIPSGKITKI